ncbi:MAG: permease-like cell division protein FtsX [Bacteroidales bacterium]|nr:permease-like cell division protein FtsX [Bacteroidales bacterium]
MTDNHRNKRRLFTANFSTVLSIALVLFLIAAMALFTFHAWYLSQQIKEEVSFTVYLTDSCSVQQGEQLTGIIAKNKMVKSAEYISSDKAMLMMNKVMGENHTDVLDGFNPYQASIEVHLKAENFSVKEIKQFIRTTEAKPEVDLVDYRDELINKINSDMYDASAFFIIILAALLIISVTLINHTINLTISNKKLLIRSMQLVGANVSFIRRPFLLKGLWLGLIAGLTADLLVFAVMFWVYTIFKGFDFTPFVSLYVIIGAAVVVLGVVLTFVFSYIAVLRNMNLKNYKLYN